jgi:RNAse (barnase) inhibitor barstar
LETLVVLLNVINRKYQQLRDLGDAFLGKQKMPLPVDIKSLNEKQNNPKQRFDHLLQMMASQPEPAGKQQGDNQI